MEESSGKIIVEIADNEEEEDEEEEEECYLETSRADKAVWLMKCPPLVSRSLQYQHNTTTQTQYVAKVVLSIDLLHSPDDDRHHSSSPQFTMELAGTESGVPKCFAMDMSKDFVPMSVFSHSEQGKLSLEGKIINKFDMRPRYQNLEDYGKLCRERTSKCMARARQIKVIDNDKGTRMRPMPGMVASGFLDKKKSPAKGSEMKRTRRDRKEVEELMFKLFETQENWTLRQLIQETDQPEQYMKDILKDICVYNHKGSNQGTYELKPEYKRSAGMSRISNFIPTAAKS